LKERKVFDGANSPIIISIAESAHRDCERSPRGVQSILDDLGFVANSVAVEIARIKKMKATQR
jgi:hypothetical protein